jgi:hypothetical protein
VTAFRLDYVFLSRYSPVFEGMLSLPSPDEVRKCDSVPLVRLHDEAEDLIPFMSVFYDPTWVLLSVPSTGTHW